MKNNNKVFYIAHYNTPLSNQNRYFAPSAVSKIDYVAKALANKYEVEIISASNSLDKNYNSKKIQLNENLSIQLLRGFKTGNPIICRISNLLFNINFLIYLLKNVKKEDIVIVYHSTLLINLITFIKRVIKFNLIIEVEEIYGDVLQNKRIISKEMKYFNIADGYIFPTILLNTKINDNGKPYCITHGTYEIEDDLRTIKSEEFSKERIHCVYAGTFDPIKGGALFALESAKFLSNKYHMHILGFGSQEETNLVINKINEISTETECKITFDGCLIGTDYKSFIQNCQFGLSTQNPNANYNDSSFPSKILSYMANGLNVVSIKIPVVETSEIAEYVYFYDEYKPEKLAKTISSIDINNAKSSKKIIRMLDLKFKEEINKLIDEVRE